MGTKYRLWVRPEPTHVTAPRKPRFPWNNAGETAPCLLVLERWDVRTGGWTTARENSTGLTDLSLLGLHEWDELFAGRAADIAHEQLRRCALAMVELAEKRSAGRKGNA